jgi:hypothetical protein
MTAPTTLDLAVLQAIDQRVAQGEQTLLAMGTVSAWDQTSPTDVQVTFDSTAIAVPCKVFDVFVAEGDRVGLAKIGRWWTVVGSFTKRWRQLLGGTQWTGGGNLVTGLNTTELVITTSASIFIPSSTRIQLSCGVRLLDSVSGSTWIFRIRDGSSVGGTERAQFTWTSPSSLFGYNQYFIGQYESGTTPVVQTYCITAVRVGGSGLLTMIAGGTLHDSHLTAYAAAQTGLIEMRSTP